MPICQEVFLFKFQIKLTQSKVYLKKLFSQAISCLVLVNEPTLKNKFCGYINFSYRRSLFMQNFIKSREINSLNT